MQAHEQLQNRKEDNYNDLSIEKSSHIQQNLTSSKCIGDNIYKQSYDIAVGIENKIKERERGDGKKEDHFSKEANKKYKAAIQTDTYKSNNLVIRFTL